MAVFENTEHVYRVIGGVLAVASRPRTFEDFRKWWGQNPSYYENGDEVEKINAIGKDVRYFALCTQFELTRPNARITVDAKLPKPGENFTVYFDDAPVTPDVVVQTTGDVAHRFLAGKVNVPIAIFTGKIKTKGPKHKALMMLASIIPAFALYPRYLELAGEERLLRYLNSTGKK